MVGSASEDFPMDSDIQSKLTWLAPTRREALAENPACDTKSRGLRNVPNARDEPQSMHDRIDRDRAIELGIV
jgi:hypothetical protein